ncbi:LexA family protein [Enterococcus dongliensis]|uniref:LexA family protein n=1 Tax=Enterococcus dongliensis TaxID=2559925 RepID=UPI002890BE84|nr:S24 family peptidase [Enterococcus dongliensis]MDT2668481.1 S24 family peptidase [Enterococcus dongliensis]
MNGEIKEERLRLGIYIQENRESLNLSQSEFGKLIGKNASTVSRYETGSVSITDEMKKKIADVLGVDYYDMPGTPAPQTKLIVSKHTVPLLGAIVAGEPLETYEVVEEIGVRDDVIQKYPKAYALKVHGESMNKKITNGAIVYVNPQKELNNGEIGVIRINGTETTMKRFHKLNDGILLEPESWLPEFQSKIYRGLDAEELHIDGKIVSWAADPRETL